MSTMKGRMIWSGSGVQTSCTESLLVSPVSDLGLELVKVQHSTDASYNAWGLQYIAIKSCLVMAILLRLSLPCVHPKNVHVLRLATRFVGEFQL